MVTCNAGIGLMLLLLLMSYWVDDVAINKAASHQRLVRIGMGWWNWAAVACQTMMVVLRMGATLDKIKYLRPSHLHPGDDWNQWCPWGWNISSTGSHQCIVGKCFVIGESLAMDEIGFSTLTRLSVTCTTSLLTTNQVVSWTFWCLWFGMWQGLGWTLYCCGMLV